MKLTVGFSTRDDRMAWMVINDLLVHHKHLFESGYGEIVVVDNSPERSAYAKQLQNHLTNYDDEVRYIRAVGPESSCIYKDRVFQEARGEIVICCDSHVIFKPRSIDRLIAHFDQQAIPRELVMGPCYRSANNCEGTNQRLYAWEKYGEGDTTKRLWKKATQHAGVVSCGGNVAHWVHDPRCAHCVDAFEIMHQGTGAFAMRKEEWTGFHKSFLGHGGNETYLMEKTRALGGRVTCLPAFEWVHCFYRPEGPPYRVPWDLRLKNYFMTAKLLNRPDLHEALETHFSVVCPRTVQKVIKDFKKPEGTMPKYLEKLKLKGRSGVVPLPLYEMLRTLVRPGMRTLEFGSGVTTLLLDDLGADHTAVESESHWVKRVGSSSVVFCDKFTENGWYDFDPTGEFDLVLIDGPLSSRGTRISARVPKMKPGGIVVVDDTFREDEDSVAKRLEHELKAVRRRVRYGKVRSFDVLHCP